MKKVQLKELAYARSGDKGDVCNVGIMAKTRNVYEFLVRTITPEKIKAYYEGMVKGDVEIYPLPNIDSLQIVLRQSLGGGATCTLRFDQTGKSMGPVLLGMVVEADEALIDEAANASAAIEKR
ncbi:MAG: hypothetical protein C4582_08220 [Desulfobacteraceae bacterium]|jgi:hypothetical protein|nr:MAG: hypothetical protein C4582_08220 [Desulfobacteraceae bacterium]